MTPIKDIAIPQTIHDLCEARAKALDLYEATLAAHKEIKKGLEAISPSLYFYKAAPELSFENFKKHLDMNLWRHAFTQIGLHQYMDARAKADLERDLEHQAPEFTLDNIKSTVLSAAADADAMFARGIVNVFHGLSDDHKTNTDSPFKINPKAIISWMFEPGWSKGLRLNYHRTEWINDIDRVIKVLDGKKHHAREIEGLITEAFRTSCTAVYEDDYYRIKGFKNGNMHIEFKRQDLLDKANAIIAKYYDGKNLAGGAKS